MAGALGGQQYGSARRPAGVTPKSLVVSPPTIAAFYKTGGSFSFSVPASDYYTVFAQGAGGGGAGQNTGSGASGGGSGSLAKSFRQFFPAGSLISGFVGSGGSTGGNNANGGGGGATTVNMGDGTSMSVPGGNPGFYDGFGSTVVAAPAAPTGAAVEFGVAGNGRPANATSSPQAGADAPSPSWFPLGAAGGPGQNGGNSGYSNTDGDGAGKGQFGSGGGEGSGTSNVRGGTGGAGFVMILRG